MTISITVSQCTFEGDGSTTTFPIRDGSNGIYFSDSSEIAVTVNGVAVSTSAYTVSGAGSDSGSVTFLAAPANGAAGVIARNTAMTQELSLTRGGYLPPDHAMAAWDKQTRIAQDLKRQVDSAVTRIAAVEQTEADIAGVVENAAAAAASALAAATSESNAATSESNAATSETNSSNFSAAAAASATIAVAAAGWSFTYSTTTTMADPGAGTLRLNNTTVWSSTAMAFDITTADSGNPDIGNWIRTWDDSTNTSGTGTLTLRKVGAAQHYAIFRVTALTDNTGWMQVTVQWVSGAPTWSDGDTLLVSFVRTGDRGAAGAGTGDMIGANNLSDVTNAGTARSNLGVGTGDSPQFAGVNIGHASDTTITRASAGVIAVEGSNVLMASDIGSTVMPYDADLATLAGVTVTSAGTALLDDANAAAQRTTLGLGSIATFDEATADQFRGNTTGKALSTDKVWSAAGTVALTDGATITPDLSTGFNFTVTLGGNRTLANPTNQKVGQAGFIRISQDSTGSRTLAYGSNWKFGSGTAPKLTTTASKVDVLFYQVTASSEVVASLVNAVV